MRSVFRRITDDKCGTCRVRLTGGTPRALLAEKIVKNLSVTCEHCTQTMTREALKTHSCVQTDKEGFFFKGRPIARRIKNGILHIKECLE